MLGLALSTSPEVAPQNVRVSKYRIGLDITQLLLNVAKLYTLGVTMRLIL